MSASVNWLPESRCKVSVPLFLWIKKLSWESKQSGGVTDMLGCNNSAALEAFEAWAAF